MLAIKDNNIRHLDSINSDAVNSDAVNNEYHWLNARTINTPLSLTKEYLNICKEFHNNNKWILMVNPENDCLDELSTKSDNNSLKVLRVHSNKVNVSVNNIETALRKGNCSVVVLCNAFFTESELTSLSASAKKGNTQCIILKNKLTFH